MKFKNKLWKSHTPKLIAISVALALTSGGNIMAQSTTGSIFGRAHVGDNVIVKSTSGVTRQTVVDASGRYTFDALPLGDYTVTLQENGATLDMRSNVNLQVGKGTEVSFISNDAKTLSAVTVQASSLPIIDVSSVDSRTVITSQELSKLPIARSAEAIALLAPGVVPGSGLFNSTTKSSATGTVVSFGGSSVTENAYYINGFNTTDPLNGFGGMTLPYGSVNQQEILTGGYDAAYGRSDGGVISQVGKSGSNAWHFGGQIEWTPTDLRSDPINFYFVNPEAGNDPRQNGSRGSLRQYRKNNKSWITTVDAYVGGPLIKDKLFLFAAVEAERQQGAEVLVVNKGVTAGFDRHYRYDNPKWYGKLDWNITDGNILELTGASNKTSYSAARNKYDYSTNAEGPFSSNETSTKNGQTLFAGKFTSYLTEDLTLTALYGKMKGTLYSITPGYDASIPYLYNSDKQDPAITGGKPITNSQGIRSLNNPTHATTNSNLRIDLAYKIGDHTIAGGIDNQNVLDSNDGSVTSGPGYSWDYGNSSDFIVGGPNANGSNWRAQPYVAAPGGTGYYVDRYIVSSTASVRTSQRAQYLQDSWQLTDRWLLKLGFRNDQFTNFNSASVPYLRLGSSQLAPRAGFSWDVNGDASLKIYGNAGRYYLALPSTVALRSAGASVFTQEYFTYAGITPDGVPTGTAPIATSTGRPFSSNSEYGIPRDPRTATAANLKSEFQDEYILGFDKKLNDSWAFGAKAMYRNLRNAIDDVSDKYAIADKMVALGQIDKDTASKWAGDGTIPGGFLINPGHTNLLNIANPAGGYFSVPMEWKQDFHFNTSLKRKYYSLDLYLSHPFDGKWFGRVDYVFSRSYGNTEGQVRSDLGQADVSATEDWDYAQVMDYAGGALSNDRRHQIKAYGAYQLTQEWMVSGNLQILSGSPRSCLGSYGAAQTTPGLGYQNAYHFCNGKPFTPGDTHNPWTYTLNLAAEYRPEWGRKSLGFNVSVFNVLNQQRILQTYAQYGSSVPNSKGQYAALNSNYLRPFTAQSPRYVRFGVTYDF